MERRRDSLGGGTHDTPTAASALGASTQTRPRARSSPWRIAEVRAALSASLIPPASIAAMNSSISRGWAALGSVQTAAPREHASLPELRDGVDGGEKREGGPGWHHGGEGAHEGEEHDGMGKGGEGQDGDVRRHHGVSALME